MSQSLAAVVRISTKQSATWRECPRHGPHPASRRNPQCPRCHGAASPTNPRRLAA